MRLPRLTTRRLMAMVAAAGILSWVIAKSVQVGIEGLYRWFVHPPLLLVFAFPFVLAAALTLTVTIVQRRGPR